MAVFPSMSAISRSVGTSSSHHHKAQVKLMTNDLTAEKGLFWMDLGLIGARSTTYGGLGVTDPSPVESLFGISILGCLRGRRAAPA